MNILITGAKSYIGEKVGQHIAHKNLGWQVEQLDVQSGSWRQYDFSKYDVVFHVAGIAHRKITKDIESIYFKVNRDLAIEVAQQARKSNVKQFIFMSSMSVYSDNLSCIDWNSPTIPDNIYGLSKLQAEECIRHLADDKFIVSIIRPPMIYGKECKGNYNSLHKIAIKFPFFPDVKNKRSMLHIDNLSEFIFQLINSSKAGIFFPQNSELVNTAEWAKCIAEENGKKLYLSRLLGVGARIGKHIPGIRGYCKKAFGDSYYKLSMSKYVDMPYQIVDFKESIKKTENKNIGKAVS